MTALGVEAATHHVVDGDILVGHSGKHDGVLRQCHRTVVILHLLYALQGDEVGHVGGIGSDDDGARVVGDAVVPTVELIPRKGFCHDGDDHTLRIGAAAAGYAHVVIGRHDSDCIGRCLLLCEVGGIHHVGRHDDGAYSIGVAVVPLHKPVAAQCCGGDGGGDACLKGAAAVHGAHRRVVGKYGDGVGVGRIGCKIGYIADVGRDGDGTDSIRVVVVPPHEMVAAQRCGGDGSGGAGSEGAAAAGDAHGGVVGIDGNGVCLGRIGGEECRVGGVAGDGDGADGVGVAVVPLHKMEAAEGGSHDAGDRAFKEAAAAADRPHARIVGEHRDGVGGGGQRLADGDVVQTQPEVVARVVVAEGYIDRLPRVGTQVYTPLGVGMGGEGGRENGGGDKVRRAVARGGDVYRIMLGMVQAVQCPVEPGEGIQEVRVQMDGGRHKPVVGREPGVIADVGCRDEEVASAVGVGAPKGHRALTPAVAVVVGIHHIPAMQSLRGLEAHGVRESGQTAVHHRHIDGVVQYGARAVDLACHLIAARRGP